MIEDENKPRFSQVDGHPGMVKDGLTGAILNTDNNALLAYKKQKSLQKNATERINALENEMGEIKGLLQQILGKL